MESALYFYNGVAVYISVLSILCLTVTVVTPSRHNAMSQFGYMV